MKSLQTVANNKLQGKKLNLTDRAHLVKERKIFKEWAEANCSSLNIREASKVLHSIAKSAGILIEGVNGQFQFRPHKPWSGKQGKKAAKYLTASGDDYDAFLPVHPNNPNYWLDIDELKKNCYQINGKPHLLLTEGAFKAIIGTQHGYPTIALLGVEMGLTSGKKDPQGRRFLVDQLRIYAEHGFGFILAFDADTYTNKNVLKALIKLEAQLKKFKISVLCLPKWDINLGKGMDDYINNLGIEEFRQNLIEQVTTVERIKEEHGDPFDDKPPVADVLGKEIAELYENKWIYSDELKTWLIYGLEKEGVWTSVSDKFIEAQIDVILEARNVEGYGTNAYIKNIFGKIQRKLIDRSWEEAPSSKFLPFTNGVLDIEKQKILPHSPDFKFTWQFPREYSLLNGDWSKIENWLDEATEQNRKYKELLICFAAATLRGRTDLQKFLYLFGIGGSGKSTYTSLLTLLVGAENTVNLNLGSLEDQHEISRIFNKRLVLFPDQDRAPKKLGNFKRLTGGDALAARKLFKDGFEFTFNGRIILSSNYPIFATHHGNWLTRRQIIIPFNCKPKKKRNLLKEFQPQLSAFTNYLLSIPESKIEEVLNDTSTKKLNLTAWQCQLRNDGISAWVNDCLIEDSDSSVKIGRNRKESHQLSLLPEELTLYGSYSQYCEQTNRTPKSPQNFSADLLETVRDVVGWKNIEKVKRSNARYISGIRLRKSSDTEPTIEDLLMLDENSLDRERENDNLDVVDSGDLKPLQNKDCVNHGDLFSILEEKEKEINKLKEQIQKMQFTSLEAQQKNTNFEEVNYFFPNPEKKVVEKVAIVDTTQENQGVRGSHPKEEMATTQKEIDKTTQKEIDNFINSIWRCQNQNQLEIFLINPRHKTKFDWLMKEYFSSDQIARVQKILSITNDLDKSQFYPEINKLDKSQFYPEINKLMEKIKMNKNEASDWTYQCFGKRSIKDLDDSEFSIFHGYLEGVSDGSLSRNFRYKE